MCKLVRWLLFLTIFFLFDSISKAIALVGLSYGKIANVFPGLQFQLIWNRGVSWGMLNYLGGLSHLILSTFIGVVTFLFILHAIRESKRGKNILFEIMVIAGALSNLLDRLLYGAVIDFIDIYIGFWHWPTFNLADAFVVIGVFGIIIRSMKDGYFRSNS